MQERDRGGMSRRQLLGIGGSLGLMTAAGFSTAAVLGTRPASTSAQLISRVPLPSPYTVPLPIPAVLKPVNTAGGVDRYELTQREVRTQILPGVSSRLWTYDGTFPGPTIEARRGRPVTIEHSNELPVPTVVHLHGGHTPASSDGYPTDLVLPRGWSDVGSSDEDASSGMHDMSDMHGMTGMDAMSGMHDPRAVVTRLHREYTYPSQQRPTQLWYHDHRMDFTAPAIWRGLAGMHIIRDDNEQNLGLPAGDRELALMITDRAFAADGDLAYPALDPTLKGRPGVEERYVGGVFGDVILVNGAPWPVHEVDAARYRLRILNASNARQYNLEAITDDGRKLNLVQIGADQGLLATPVTLSAVPIAPAERYDVVIDFTGIPIGSRVRLVNTLGSGHTRDVMAFRVARAATDDSRIPHTLATDLPMWQRSDASAVRDFAFRAGRMGSGQGWLIDGKPFDPDRPDVTTALGDVEVWRLIADADHPVHLHLVGFRILTRNGHEPLPHDTGLKDTVSLRPGEAVEIITRFEGWSGRYLFHCHNAEHEDMGMMANLELA
ncbi:MAG TPA: multicopper oxidase domain-containing protein [Humibacter sp.]|nr:multicopper oxidase domain-containing protein [Humibacter sp.]